MSQETQQSRMKHSGPSVPVKVDVYARREGDDVTFDHDWRFEGDASPKKGRIDVPKGAPDTPIFFHLHDSTALHLAFKSPASEACWVDLNDCPTQAGNGGQISFVSRAPKLLKISDANSGPACVLHYALRFDGDPLGKCPPYVYDPEIRNGGGDD